MKVLLILSVLLALSAAQENLGRPLLGSFARAGTLGRSSLQTTPLTFQSRGLGLSSLSFGQAVEVEEEEEEEVALCPCKEVEEEEVEIEFEAPRVPINPRVAMDYIAQLYQHGEYMINRAKSIEGGNQRGPTYPIPPLAIPAGYEPERMDALYAKLFFYMGRCNTPWFRRVTGNPSGPATEAWRYCADEAAKTWIVDDLDSYVEHEFSHVIHFLETSPQSLGFVVPGPSVASFAPAYSREQLLGFRMIPRAVYRVWQSMLVEAKRVVASVGPPAADLDSAFMTPAAAIDFGFPPGFVVEGANQQLLNIIFVLMKCQVPWRRGAEAEMFDETQGAWTFGPVQDRQYGSCVEHQMDHYFEDHFDDWALDTATAFAEFVFSLSPQEQMKLQMEEGEVVGLPLPGAFGTGAFPSTIAAAPVMLPTAGFASAYPSSFSSRFSTGLPAARSMQYGIGGIGVSPLSSFGRGGFRGF